MIETIKINVPVNKLNLFIYQAVLSTDYTLTAVNFNQITYQLIMQISLSIDRG